MGYDIKIWWDDNPYDENGEQDYNISPTEDLQCGLKYRFSRSNNYLSIPNDPVEITKEEALDELGRLYKLLCDKVIPEDDVTYVAEALIFWSYILQYNVYPVWISYA